MKRLYLDIKIRCNFAVCKKATGYPHWLATSAKMTLTYHASHFDVHVESCNTHHAYRITRMWSRSLRKTQTNVGTLRLRKNPIYQTNVGTLKLTKTLIYQTNVSTLRLRKTPIYQTNVGTLKLTKTPAYQTNVSTLTLTALV